jgi:hypothetical protein
MHHFPRDKHLWYMYDLYNRTNLKGKEEGICYLCSEKEGHTPVIYPVCNTRQVYNGYSCWTCWTKRDRKEAVIEYLRAQVEVMSTITVDQFGLAKQNNAEFKLQTPKEQKIEISKDEAGGLSKGEQRKQVTTTDDKVKKLEKTLAVGVTSPIASIFSKMKGGAVHISRQPQGATCNLV